MRKFVLTLAAAAVTVTAGMLAPSSADAAVLAPSAMQSSVIDTAMVEDVRWVRRCHRHRGHLHCSRVWVGGRHHGHHHHHHHHRGHRR